MKTTLAALALALITHLAQSQAGQPASSPPAVATPTLDSKARTELLSQVIGVMHKEYVFPEKAKAVETALRAAAKQSDWGGLDGPALARRLTEVLQSATQDLHLRVWFQEQVVPPERDEQPAPEAIAAMRATQQSMNFGVERVERLPGNVGLLELRGFAPVDWSGDKLTAAMTLLADTDALIVDLRRNGGGDPNAVALLSSYLFEERTHLNSLYWRPTDSTSQYWTQDWVPGKRFGASKPVYVLTSKRTFSAAEEFSYNLQQLKRATLVGETTGGGAHPGRVRRLADHFEMFVATGRAINPISKTNWEGTGVRPTIETPAPDALRQAQLHVLPLLREKHANAPELQKALDARIQELQSTP